MSEQIIEKIKDFKINVPFIWFKWHSTIKNYETAYTTAYRKWEKTMEEQRQADKFKADLALTALSLCSGSILTALFAGVALKTIAGNKVLDFICKHNMNKTFNAAYWVQGNPTARFCVDAIWNKTEDMFENILKVKTRQMIARTGSYLHEANSLVPEPHLVLPPLEAFLSNCAANIGSACDDIINCDENPATKEQALYTLKKSGFCFPITKLPDDLAKKIELTFYLKKVLNSDEVVHYTKFNILGGRPVEISRKPIHKLPNQRGYPTSGDIGFDRRQEVEYGSIGQDIIDRMNYLCKEIFKGKYPYIINSKYHGEPTSAQIITRANTILEKLGVDNWDFIKPYTTL